MKSIFFQNYQRFLAEAVKNDFTDNYDHDRFGPLATQPAQPTEERLRIPDSLPDLKSMIRDLLSRAKRASINLIQTGSPWLTQGAIAERWLQPHIEKFQWLYDHLQDDESKSLLINLLAYRALGYRHVKLPLNTPEFWEARKQIISLREGAETMETGLRGWQMYRTNLRPFGFPFELFIRGIQTQFQLQQYRCPFNGGAIEVTPGDIVIDAGGCYGDTAFYFAHKTGSEGHVYSFEFLPENLSIFNRNLEINPEYSKRITILKHPLWSASGLDLFIEGHGPATRVREHTSNPSALKVQTLSIDGLADRESLQRVDFIKMDIEGAELPALQGAEQSIRRFRPKLAISVYHHLQDFWEIPQWIDSLDLGYRFYLRHFTIHQEETVLFAQAPR